MSAHSNWLLWRAQETIKMVAVTLSAADPQTKVWGE